MSAHAARTIAAAAAWLAAATATAWAQEYPARPVEVIVPFAAGGGSELLARLISDGLSRRLGQPFVVLNRPGANTNLGTLAAVRSKPDGYTLLIASVGLAANPSLYKRLPFEPQSDLAPIMLIANSPTVLAVPTSLPVRSLTEFIAYAKARPGQLNYGSYGVGSGPHLATELFRAPTGIEMVHVPYGGGGPAAVAAMTNQVQALFSSILPVLGMLRSGSLRALAIASDRRSDLLPDVPTFAENGVDYRTGTWFGLLAPMQTPHEIIGLLHRSAAAVLAEPGTRSRIVEQGAEVIAGTPDEFRGFIRKETERLSSVIRASGIQVE